jgi:ABC-type cobalamin/Fe3+-siderophores transport system ATPase subunit
MTRGDSRKRESPFGFLREGDMKIVIENVRRLERAEITIGPRSRTVVVGKNNAGKTTLLDMVARALWSLPGPYNDSFRQ